MAAKSEEGEEDDLNRVPAIYALIGNIPRDFHTPDLRNFFAHSIENDFFLCFNFRHRPDPKGECNTCVCKVRANKYDQLCSMYHNKNWLSASTGLIVPGARCSIAKVRVAAHKDSPPPPSTTSSSDSSMTTLTEKEIEQLLEFRNIPKWMPQGNVGTPTRTFISYINRCIMPQSLITKLGIDLRHYRAHRKRPYSSVPYKYDNDDDDNCNDEDGDAEATSSQADTLVACTANGQRITDEIVDDREIRERNYAKICADKEKSLLDKYKESGEEE